MKHGGKRKGAGRPKGQGKYGEPTKAVRLPISMIQSVMKYIDNKSYQRIPLYSSKVAAGFPSPADDHVESHLDLNEHLVKHPAATFFVKVTGDSMVDANIHENDILIVDRSLTPMNGRIVVAAVDGQLTVKRLHMKDNKLTLLPANSEFTPIEVDENNEVYIWGVVTNVIHAINYTR